jgi:hypothetical protein
MKTLFALLLATLCAATSYGQTIKSLGYNTTNGQIVAATNVVWTNAFSFSTNVVATIRTNLGLGATNSVSFASVTISGGDNIALTGYGVSGGSFNGKLDFEENALSTGDGDWNFEGTGIYNAGTIQFDAPTYASTTRTNLGIPLAALTNDSNVRLMRALSGSTNTNHPFSGTISVTGTNNTNTLVFSNGILQSVQ